MQSKTAWAGGAEGKVMWPRWQLAQEQEQEQDQALADPKDRVERTTYWIASDAAHVQQHVPCRLEPVGSIQTLASQRVKQRVGVDGHHQEAK